MLTCLTDSNSSLDFILNLRSRQNYAVLSTGASKYLLSTPAVVLWSLFDDGQALEFHFSDSVEDVQYAKR